MEDKKLVLFQVKFSPGSPTDVNLVTVAGQGVFRALRAEDMGFKVVQHSLTKKENTNFTSHAWVDGEGQAMHVAILPQEAACMPEDRTSNRAKAAWTPQVTGWLSAPKPVSSSSLTAAT